jgi:TonB-dependent starch-binding outer membrane protein SusC
MMKKLNNYANRMGKVCLHLTFLCLLFFSSTVLYGQTGKVVTGNVLDQDGNPIVGAQVFVPQTTIKTKTNDKGSYLINLPSSVNSFVVMAKGKQRQQVTVGDRTTVNVRMLPFSSNDVGDANDDLGTGGKKKKKKMPKGERALVGTVKDEKGEPIPSASVVVTGTQKGVVTDLDGRFFLTMPAGQDSLTVSFIGFETQNIEVGDNEAGLAIILSEVATKLNEVVVVGYGAQKRANITGAVSDVNFKDLENLPQSSVINMLSGRMAGVSIVQPGGEPGADQGEILVRGIGTLNNSEPLVVIDGAVSNLSTFNNLTPVEIASVSVLKDASSAAIYGARGANGVILVTTKEPQKSRLNINVNLQQSVQTPTYLPQFVNSWQWMTLHNEATANPANPAATPNYPYYAIENVKNGILNDTFANTDWVKETYRTGMLRNANINVNGGNNNASFQGAFGVIDQEGIMKGFSSRRYNYRSNIRLRAGDRVDVGLNFFGFLQNADGPFASSATVINRINQAFPITPARYSNGAWGVNYPGAPASIQAVSVVPNPVLTTEIGSNLRKTLNNNMLAFMNYRPFKGMILRGSFSYATDNTTVESFNPTYDYRGINPLQTGMQVQKNTLINSNSTSRQFQTQLTANYSKVFNEKHSINLLGGYEYTDFADADFEAEGRDLPSNDQQVLGNALSDLRVAGDKSAWRLQSFFGRMNYSFDNKYIIEGNLRVDGSSRFPTNEKYGIFPSFSAGWIVSNESFFQPLTKAISLLKFRGGWGVVGNDRIGNYPYQQVYNTRSFYPLGDVLNVGVSQNRFSNANIRWEETATTNLGLDAAFMDNRLFLNVDLFKKVTDGILYQLALPSSFGGITPANLNVAQVSNKGVEVNLEYKTSIRKLFVNIGGNFTYFKNNVDKLESRSAVNGNFILREGYPINSYYIMQHRGIYKDSTEYEKYPLFNNNANTKRIGALYFYDTNNDGKVDLDDRIPNYSSNTPITFGGTVGLSYKGFDLNVLVQGVQNKYIYIGDFGNRPGNAGNTNFWKEWWDNRYDPVSNPNGTWPVLKRQSPEAGAASTFFLGNASYVRIRNIEFGYSLPSTIMKKWGMRTFRIYMNGNNLFTFSKLIKQIDPERASNVVGNSPYPQLKTVSAGINLGF